MLAQILQKKNKKTNQNNASINIFDQQNALIINNKEEVIDEPKIEKNMIIPKQKMEFEVIENIESVINPIEKDRENKTIFVGNINLKTKKKTIYKYFLCFGEIEKMWIRSVQVEQSKLPQKAKVILKQFKEDGTYNSYILFKNEDSVEKALQANGQVIDNNHIRIDKAFNKTTDYNFTIFIGNLPFTIKDEQLYQFFENCGKIQYIRVIRDSQTYFGKGIGYASFCDKESYQKALLMNGTYFEDRPLRIKKAVPLKRLQKKQLKTQKIKKQLNPAELRLRKKQQEGKTEKRGINKKSQKIKKVKKEINKDSNIFAQ